MRKFISNLACLLFSVFAVSCSGGDIIVDRTDGVSGRRNVLIQQADGTTIRISDKGRRTHNRSISAGEMFHDSSCTDWNEELKVGALVFRRGVPTSKSEDAQLLLAYMQGVLDVRGILFDEDVWDELKILCAESPHKQLSRISKGRLSWD